MRWRKKTEETNVETEVEIDGREEENLTMPPRKTNKRKKGRMSNEESPEKRKRRKEKR